MNARNKLFWLWGLTILAGIYLNFIFHYPITGVSATPTIHTSGSSATYLIILTAISLLSAFILLQLGPRALKWYINITIYGSIALVYIELISLTLIIAQLQVPAGALNILHGGILLIAGLLTLLTYCIKRYWPNFVTFLFGAIFIGFMSITLGPFWLWLFLAIMSLYDFLAVFVFKSMQKLAGKLATISIVPFAFVAGDISQVQRRLAGDEKAKVGLLGLGDAIIPGAFIASLFVVSPWVCLGAFWGAIGGLYGNLLISKRTGAMLPALPLILAGATIGWLLSAIIFLGLNL